MFGGYDVLSRPVTACAALLGALLLGPLTPTAHAQTVEVKVDASSLLCMNTTAEPFSDEVFIAGSWIVPATGARGKIVIPPASQDHFGDVDGNEWVFSSSSPKQLWRGFLANGQAVSISLNFTEKDEGPTASQWAQQMFTTQFERMAQLSNPSNWFNSKALFDAMTLDMQATIAWLFAGENDPLGFVTINVRNVNGAIQKEVIANQYARIGTGVKYEYGFASDYAAYRTKLQEGWQLLSMDWCDFHHTFEYYPRRPTYYGALSETGKTVRLLLDGQSGAPQLYHASFQVRTGMTSSNPDGNAHTWTLNGSYRAY